MKYFYILIVLILVVIAVGIYSYPRFACEAQGGMWVRVGLSPQELCNLPTSDAGKECSDHSECEGVCLAEQTGEGVKGKCSEWKMIAGCHQVVEGGEVFGVCWD